jgi:hypothetical protein
MSSSMGVTRLFFNSTIRASLLLSFSAFALWSFQQYLQLMNTVAKTSGPGYKSLPFPLSLIAGPVNFINKFHVSAFGKVADFSFDLSDVLLMAIVLVLFSVLDQREFYENQSHSSEKKQGVVSGASNGQASAKPKTAAEKKKKKN